MMWRDEVCAEIAKAVPFMLTEQARRHPNADNVLTRTLRWRESLEALEPGHCTPRRRAEASNTLGMLKAWLPCANREPA